MSTTTQAASASTSIGQAQPQSQTFRTKVRGGVDRIKRGAQNQVKRGLVDKNFWVWLIVAITSLVHLIHLAPDDMVAYKIKFWLSFSLACVQFVALVLANKLQPVAKGMILLIVPVLFTAIMIVGYIIATGDTKLREFAFRLGIAEKMPWDCAKGERYSVALNTCLPVDSYTGGKILKNGWKLDQSDKHSYVIKKTYSINQQGNVDFSLLDVLTGLARVSKTQVGTILDHDGAIPWLTMTITCMVERTEDPIMPSLTLNSATYETNKAMMDMQNTVRQLSPPPDVSATEFVKILVNTNDFATPHLQFIVERANVSSRVIMGNAKVISVELHMPFDPAPDQVAECQKEAHQERACQPGGYRETHCPCFLEEDHAREYNNTQYSCLLRGETPLVMCGDSIASDLNCTSGSSLKCGNFEPSEIYSDAAPASENE